MAENVHFKRVIWSPPQIFFSGHTSQVNGVLCAPKFVIIQNCPFDQIDLGSGVNEHLHPFDESFLGNHIGGKLQLFGTTTPGGPTHGHWSNGVPWWWGVIMPPHGGPTPHGGAPSLLGGRWGSYPTFGLGAFSTSSLVIMSLVSLATCLALALAIG